jgi:predicted metalloendopeptidase
MQNICSPESDPNCYFNNSTEISTDIFEKVQHQIDKILLAHTKSDDYFKILRKSFDQRNTFTNSYNIFSNFCKGIFGACNPTLYANLSKALIIRGFTPIHSYSVRANSLPQTDTYIPIIGEFFMDSRKKKYYDAGDRTYADSVATKLKPYAELVKMLYAERPNFVKNVLETEILFSKVNKPDDESGLPTRDNVMLMTKFLDTYDKVGIWRIILPKSKYIHVENEQYVAFLDKYFTEASWEKIQDYLAWAVLSKYEIYLDASGRIKISEDELFLTYCKDHYGPKLQQVYENEFGPDKKLYLDGVKNMCFDLKNYCERNISFPTQATTLKARAKIGSLSVFVGVNPVAGLFERVPESFILSDSDFYENAINADMAATTIFLDQIGLTINPAFPLDMNGAWSYDVNAFYDASSNSLYIPTSMFAKTFYYPYADPVHNFSGLGCIIGHEMMHCFDMYGSLYDSKGKLNTWWTKPEYDYYVKEILKINNSKNGVPSALSESMADVYGIKLSLRTYISLYGSTKLEYFFAHWARIMGTINAQGETDEHSDGNFRVNVSFSHIPEYYVTFGVKPSDKNYLKPNQRSNFFF